MRELSLAANVFPPGFEEDEQLRSDFIRELVLQRLACAVATATGNVAYQAEFIPRTLVQYWDDPLAVPADVRQCLDSWEALEAAGISMRMFGDASAHAFISERYGQREVAAFERCRHPAMRSDYFRMCFLLAEGGLYVDADDVLLSDNWSDVFRGHTLKLQPLCYDINARGMVSAADLRRMDLPTDGRTYYVNNNPIAAPAHHPVLRRALLRSTDLLLGEESAPEIQSTTGPGNLTASLAAHAREAQTSDALADYELLLDWDSTAQPRWELAYRNDARNWRNMDRG